MFKFETKDKDDISDWDFNLVDENTGLELDIDCLPITISKREVMLLIDKLMDILKEMK